MLKKIILLCLLLSGFLFAQQYSNDKYEKYVGTKLGKYPLTVPGLKKAINALDSGVVYVAYPGLWDTTGLGPIPNKITLQGFLFGDLFLGDYSGLLFNISQNAYKLGFGDVNLNNNHTQFFLDDNLRVISFGDLTGWNNYTQFILDDEAQIVSIGDVDNGTDGLKFILDSKNNKVKLGDVENNNYNVKLVMDESSVRLGDVDFDGSGIYGLGFQFVINPDYGWLKMGDILNNSTGMKIELDYQDGIKIGDTDNTDNGTQIIINDSDQQILIPNMPSDSTGCVSGQLWFNKSTGAIHRKF